MRTRRRVYDKMINIKVEPDLKKAIFRESDKKRIPASVLMRAAIEAGLAEDREKMGSEVNV